MAFDLSLVVFFVPFVALAAALTALILAIAMQVRVKRIFKSASVPDLEKLIALHTKTLEELLRFKSEASGYMSDLNQRLRHKTVAASTLRFNSFQGEGLGGNQSFSTVLADEQGDGVVLTGMHTRERTNIFAKPLSKWQSQYGLLDEEKKIIDQAQNNSTQARK